MNEPAGGLVTQLVRAAGAGNAKAAEELLPLVYAELRRLAQAKMAKTPPGNTLQPTALVHEAYVRLVGVADQPNWNSRGHFFAAAAEAMRQILVDQARRKAALKHGGGRKRIDATPEVLADEAPLDDILALDEALTRLKQEDPRKGEIVMLRYFAGLGRDEAAAAVGISVATLDREWRYIVARLHRDLAHQDFTSQADQSG
jgi:RNA polymerase sigma factor (TIGR02999 family)